jgi:hypothetical protein
MVNPLIDILLILISILHQYMKDNSEGTFITRMYFLGSIGKGNSKTYFCMFNNIFNNPEMKPDSVYDLKGSIHNRKTGLMLLFRVQLATALSCAASFSQFTKERRTDGFGFG